MSTESTTTAEQPQQPAPPPQTTHDVPAVWNAASAFNLAARQAKAYASATIVPEQYRDNVANCLIAVNMANRIGMDVLQVMQNLYIVHGHPGWSGQFLIAAFNQCGRYSSMRFETRGDIDKKENNAGMRAYATEKATGEVVRGPWVTWAMVKGEKWDAKSGSKWLTIPELMFMYRAAAFLVRTHAPEIAMGLQTAEEVADVIDVTPTGQDITTQSPSAIERAKAAVQTVLEGSATTEPEPEPEREPGPDGTPTYEFVADLLTRAVGDDAKWKHALTLGQKLKAEERAKLDILAAELKASAAA
jgi:hypothetical protein